jgi:hypothetical protein
MEDAMSEPENGEEARRMRAVGDEQPDVPAPGAVVEHVLDRFNLTLARLDGGSNSGAYVAVPPWLVVLAMSVLDPVGEQLDYYDLYGFEDQVENDGDLEVQIFRWLYTLPSSIAMALWPVLVTDPRSGGPHRPRGRHRAVPFFLTPDFGTDMHRLTRATGMTREELVEQAVLDMAERSDLLDLIEGTWAGRKLRIRRGGEPTVGRDQLALWWLGPNTSRLAPGERAQLPLWPGYPPVELVVASPCQSASDGVWLCISHNRELAHSATIEDHTTRGGDHQLAWLCRTHGLEGPPSG